MNVKQLSQVGTLRRSTHPFVSGARDYVVFPVGTPADVALPIARDVLGADVELSHVAPSGMPVFRLVSA